MRHVFVDYSTINVVFKIKGTTISDKIKVVNGVERVDEKIIPVIPTGENSFDITFSFIK